MEACVTKTDAVFTGSIPSLYDKYLGPLIFEPYAEDLAQRVAALDAGRVLETAAGTGIVTRALTRSLPASVEIVATDLNQPMIDHAAAQISAGRVTWQPADAQSLPFPDGAFDVVVCQFGAMFFPDKPRAFAEARRVLRPSGVFFFNVWDRIEENEFADVVTAALETVFPDDPPRFLARTPHGYHDKAAIARDLVQGGFTATPDIVTIAEVGRADSARVPAVAFCQGTPLRNEIEARDASRLETATDVAARAIARRFGDGAVEGRIRAHVVSIEA
jgi:SAM-dependent methyltransferase